MRALTDEMAQLRAETAESKEQINGLGVSVQTIAEKQDSAPMATAQAVIESVLARGQTLASTAPVASPGPRGLVARALGFGSSEPSPARDHHES